MSGRRVVVTGMGLVSCLGNDLKTVSRSLRESTSGIVAVPNYVEQGLRTHVAGMVAEREALRDRVDRKLARFMGDAAIYSHLSAEQAVQQAGLSAEDLKSDRVGVVAGSGGGSPVNQVELMDVLREKGIRRVGAFRVPRVMSSTVSANLSTAFGTQGINYSISSACATGVHNIGVAAQQIAAGLQDIVLAGGADEESIAMTAPFDAMGALSTKYNDTPELASRPFAGDRDGFVVGEGAAILVLEALEHAEKRGANIIAEVVGYAATADGADMVAPSGGGAVRAMKIAMEDLDGPIDYINAHGTSTPAGDMTELKAIRDVFGPDIPPISSTKGITGHALGAAGSLEAVFSLIMLTEGFLAANKNLSPENMDPEAKGFPLLLEVREQPMSLVMTNSFGFGGTNGVLVFRKV